MHSFPFLMRFPNNQKLGHSTSSSPLTQYSSTLGHVAKAKCNRDGMLHLESIFRGHFKAVEHLVNQAFLFTYSLVPSPMKERGVDLIFFVEHPYLYHS